MNYNGPVLLAGQPIVDLNGQPQLAVAPGSWIKILGSQLAQSALQADSSNLPTKLGTTSVSLGGKALQLQSVSPAEIVAQVPGDVPTKTLLPLVVAQGEYLSAPEAVLVADTPVTGHAASRTGVAVSK